MGMAASQARLLSLTSRLHDVEYKAQNIQNQKIALATQKDELYQNYCDALDAKKIQVAFNNGNGSRSFVDATFATLCSFDPNGNRFKQYSLIDANSGKVYVSDDIADMYETFCTSDKYTFAFAMLGMSDNFGWTKGGNNNPNQMGIEVGIGTAGRNYGDGGSSENGYNLFMTDVERKVFANHSDDEKLNKLYTNLTDTCNSPDKTTRDKQDALKEFREYLYKEYSSEIYDYMRLNKNAGSENNDDPHAGNADFDEDFPEDFPKNEFDYYVRIFEQIQASGGCITIDPQYEAGESGNDWLNNMVNSGRVLIEVYEGSQKGWTETSVATSTNTNYLQENADDTDLKKAEAEYEHELSIINRKDTRFDQDLNKLETERTAITTEMESLEKVKNDNIERTFGIFS